MSLTSPQRRHPDVSEKSEFMCKCGYSLMVEESRDATNRVQHYRVRCSRHNFTESYKGLHDEPGHWVSSADEARQVWAVTKAMTRRD